jgi:DNA-nicking Smr family endonuclease
MKKKDKKGIAIISHDNEIWEAFLNNEPSQDSKSNQEIKKKDDFEELLRKSLSNCHFQQALEEKTMAAKPPIPVSRLIKHWPSPQEEIDLHHCTAQQAESAVLSFLAKAAAMPLLTVRIIVGKGFHSKGEAILPGLVENLLHQSKKRNQILTFRWENKNIKAKSGAIIVYFPKK